MKPFINLFLCFAVLLFSGKSAFSNTGDTFYSEDDDGRLRKYTVLFYEDIDIEDTISVGNWKLPKEEGIAVYSVITLKQNLLAELTGTDQTKQDINRIEGLYYDSAENAYFYIEKGKSIACESLETEEYSEFLMDFITSREDRNCRFLVVKDFVTIYGDSQAMRQSSNHKYVGLVMFEVTVSDTKRVHEEIDNAP